jgi:hypothetical protein
MSEELLHEALLQEAERCGVIDPDILQAYPDEIAGAKLDASGKPDVASIVGAIRKIKSRVPALFKEQDFSRMDDATYAEAEKKFREKLSRHAQAPSRNNEFRSLDAVSLSETEQHALRRYLGGTRNSYDASILNAALKRQNGPDAA